MVGEHLAEMRPAEVEDAAEVAEGHQDAGRGIGGDGDVDAAVHALEDGDGGRVLGEIAFARQPGFRSAKGFAMAAGEIEEPVDTLSDRVGCGCRSCPLRQGLVAILQRLLSSRSRAPRFILPSFVPLTAATAKPGIQPAPAMPPDVARKSCGRAARLSAGAAESPTMRNPFPEPKHENRQKRHRTGRQYPAGQAQPHHRRLRRDDRRQAGVLQPGTQRQGPHRGCHARCGTGGRQASAPIPSCWSRPRAIPASASPWSARHAASSAPSSCRKR